MWRWNRCRASCRPPADRPWSASGWLNFNVQSESEKDQYEEKHTHVNRYQSHRSGLYLPYIGKKRVFVIIMLA